MIHGWYFLKCTFAPIHSGWFSYFSLSSLTHRFNILQWGDLTFLKLQNSTAINKQILHVQVTLQDFKPKRNWKTGRINTPPAFPESLGFKLLHFTDMLVPGLWTAFKTFPHKNFSWWGSYQLHKPRHFQTWHQYWHTISRKWALETIWSNLLLLLT